MLGGALVQHFSDDLGWASHGLHHQFVVAVTVTNLVFWLVLGAVIGVVRGRFTGTATSLRDSFA